MKWDGGRLLVKMFMVACLVLAITPDQVMRIMGMAGLGIGYGIYWRWE